MGNVVELPIAHGNDDFGVIDCMDNYNGYVVGIHHVDVLALDQPNHLGS